MSPETGIPRYTVTEPTALLSPSRKLLKEKLRRFWNGQELYWDLLTQEIAANSENRAKAAAFIPPAGRVLDVACGRAANCVLLQDRTGYFGVDLSMGGLRRIQTAGLRAACADSEALPFADGTFDAVLATYALEHSVNPMRMLEEIVRVVKSKGRIVLLGPTWDFPFWYPSALQSKAKSKLWRCRYTAVRFLRQLIAMLGGPLPFQVIEEPDALSGPFVPDADAVYVVWTYEVVHALKRLRCNALHLEVDEKLLGASWVARTLKKALATLPAYRHAGSTSLMVFERETAGT